MWQSRDGARSRSKTRGRQLATATSNPKGSAEKMACPSAHINIVWGFIRKTLHCFTGEYDGARSLAQPCERGSTFGRLALAGGCPVPTGSTTRPWAVHASHLASQAGGHQWDTFWHDTGTEGRCVLGICGSTVSVLNIGLNGGRQTRQWIARRLLAPCFGAAMEGCL